MHHHKLRNIKSKNTNRTLYFQCDCGDDIRITRGNFRRMFVLQKNPRRQRNFINRFKSGGSLNIYGEPEFWLFPDVRSLALSKELGHRVSPNLTA